MSINVVPWILAAAGAGWFGWIAYRTNRNWIASAITGGLFALIISTFIFGLGNATSIPFSDRERASVRLLWTLASAGIVTLVGSMFTFWLWRKPLPSTRLGSDKPPVDHPAEDKPKAGA
jgi:hypothetical protein